jgi:hypothetical protein
MLTLARFKDHAQNIRGWRTDRRLVVFESDDWGAIRMPGQKAFDVLARSTKGVELSRYDAIDCLEDQYDLDELAGVLSSTCDSRGRPACFTTNMVMGNPEFEAIRESRFDRFVHEPFHITYQRHHGKDLLPQWRDLAEAGLVKPQFHAREHLNAPFWMADLRAGNPATREAFEHGFYGLKCKTGRPDRTDYLAAYDPASDADLPEYRAILGQGLKMFEDLFRQTSLTMVPCNYVWPEALDNDLMSAGVRCLQGTRVEFRVIPRNQPAKTKAVRRQLGHRRHSGLRDLVRNVSFEPYRSQTENHVERAMAQIRAAFLWKKPAVISTHRINYVGGMRMDLRAKHLKALRQLLDQITRRWPDVEFLSSDELATTVLQK